VSRRAYQIETRTLCLRCPRFADAANLVAAVNDNRAQLVSWIDPPLATPTLDAAVAALRRAQGLFHLDQLFTYVVFTRGASPRLIGQVRHTPGAGGRAALSYWLDRGHTGRGLATEAVGAVARAALAATECVRVEILCAPENQRSARLAERLGFRHEGTLRRRAVVGGERADEMMWALLASDLVGSAAGAIEMRATDALGRILIDDLGDRDTAVTELERRTKEH
jgi:RimJ/RimL family protein N-acetyltransferase